MSEKTLFDVVVHDSAVGEEGEDFEYLGWPARSAGAAAKSLVCHHVGLLIANDGFIGEEEFLCSVEGPTGRSHHRITASFTIDEVESGE